MTTALNTVSPAWGFPLWPFEKNRSRNNSGDHMKFFEKLIKSEALNLVRNKNKKTKTLNSANCPKGDRMPKFNRINETTCFGWITLPDLMSYPRQTTFETSTQMSSITFRIYHPWLIPNLFQSEILSSFEKVKTLKSFTYISEKNSNSLTRHRCDRYRPRFFDQVGHQTMYASMGNKHFISK